MSDPITIGAGVGAGVSMLRGGNPLQGAAVGGLGGAGYGALTGSGMAGNLLSQGGLFGAGATGSSTIPSILTTEGAKGVAPSVFDKLGGAMSGMGTFAKENPMLTMMGATSLMQPQPSYQMNPVTPSPSPMPSDQSMNNYIPAHLQSQVQKPRIDVTSPTMGATNPYRTFGFGGANMFRDPEEALMMTQYPQY